MILQGEGESANGEEMEGGEKNAKGLEVVENIGRGGGEHLKRRWRSGRRQKRT